MSVFNRFRGADTKDAPRARAVTLKKQNRTLKGINRVHADNVAMANEAIYAAVSRIANTMASMPIHLYKGRVIADDHAMERIIGYKPNDSMSTFTFIQTMEAARNIEGNTYALIRRDNTGRAIALDVLDPTRVQPKRETETRELWYYVSMDDGKSYPLPGCELIVLKHMSANGEMGVKPVDVLRGSLDYDRQIKEFSLAQLNGVNSGVFLNVPSAGLSPEAKERVIDDFLDAYDRSGQRVVILEGGLTAQNFSQSPVDAKIMDVERITRNRVATVYNIPPHLLGDATDQTLGTAEQQMQEFVNLCILPIVTQWEQELNRKLLTEKEFAEGYRFRFDMNQLRRADTSTMANMHQMAIRGGWMTPNEVREQECLPPMEDGAQLMSSRDLIPLNIAVNDPGWLLGARPNAQEAEE